MAKSNQAAIAKSIEEWTIKKINSAQDQLVSDIKADTPVDTGRARDGTQSIATVSKLGDTGIIRNEVPYIGWLEYGTEKVAEHAMFRRSIAKVGK